MKTKKFAILLVILSLLIPSVIFADSVLGPVSVEECTLLKPTIGTELIGEIISANQTKKLKYSNCISKTPQFLLQSGQPIHTITNDPAIINFQKTVNQQKGCLYIDITNISQITNAPPQTSKTIIVNNLPLETIKAIDQAGNDNCKIDTNNEKCKQKIEEEKIYNHDRTIAKIKSEKYGCYGTSTSPKTLQQYLEGDRGNTANQRVDVFDQRTGLIASKGQLDKLTNIAKAQGGPVIGFFNFIIDYLVSIVFVLCMASLIYGGYNLIFSGFDQDMAEKGKKAIQYAIYGFLFIMLSYTIVLLVQSIF